jgi:RNA polymerase sigma factor (TIGR02999 family)
MSAIFNDLHRIAKKSLRNERAAHTLCPTSLISECYMKLFNGPIPPVVNRAHFYAIAARAMRQILIDHARTKKRNKREGVVLTTGILEYYGSEEKNVLDIMQIEQVLAQLEALDERQAAIVELKFYGGLNIQEIGEVLGISEATVKREWSTARLFIKSRIME